MKLGRVVPGLLMAGGWVLLLLLAPRGLFWLAVLGLAWMALNELFTLGDSPMGQRSIRYPASAIGLAPVLFSLSGSPVAVSGSLAGSLLLLVALCLARYDSLREPFATLTLGGFGYLYLSFTLSHLVLLHSLEQGPYWLLVLAAITAGSDTGAYYSGRAFGHRKLCPSISPNKTVAGAVGGLVAGTGAALAMAFLLSVDVAPLALLLAAPGLVVIGILGDLAESVIKRSLGVKDSGALLGAHGGLLDRIDSLLLTAPALYYCLALGLL